MSLYAAPLAYELGFAVRVLLRLIETTEQKWLETHFTQSPKMQAVCQLAGGIARDFDDLLTAMIGFCDLLLKCCWPGEETFADVMQIKQHANCDASLFRQLLAFERQQTLAPRNAGKWPKRSVLRGMRGRTLL